MTLYRAQHHSNAWSYQSNPLADLVASSNVHIELHPNGLSIPAAVDPLNNQLQPGIQRSDQRSGRNQEEQARAFPVNEESSNASVAQSSTNTQGQAEVPARKNSTNPVRRRTSRACDQCNQLRTKCDGRNPCGHCIETGQTCEYARLRKKRGKASKKDLVGRVAAEDHKTRTRGIDSNATTKRRPTFEEDSQQHGVHIQQSNILPVGTYQNIVATQLPNQSRGEADGSGIDGRSDGSPQTPNMSAISDTGGSAPSAHMVMGGAVTNPMAMGFQNVSLDNFGNADHVSNGRLNSMDLSHVYNVDVSGLQDDSFMLGAFNHQRDSPLNPLLDGSVAALSPEVFAGIQPQTGNSVPSIKYPVLLPLLPYIKQILPQSLACELLEYYFASSSSAHPHPVSPYLPGFVFSKRSFLTPQRPRKCSPALLSSMLWIAARTSDARALTSPPSTRGRICQKLLNLSVSLLQPLIHGSAAGKAISEYPGRLIINGSALGGDGVTLGNLTPDQIAAGTVDDVATYMHLAIVVSASEDKAASIRWWNVAWALVKELKLGQELPPTSEHVGTVMNHHDEILGEPDDEMVLDSTAAPVTEEEREERRRLWWILYIVDRHLALCYNRPLILLERDCQGLHRPMDERAWQSGKFAPSPPTVSGVLPSSSRFEFTGPSVFGWFLPLMTILGEIVDLHYTRQNPLLHGLPRNMQYWDGQIQKLIGEQLEAFERSIQAYQAQHAVVLPASFNENGTAGRASQSMTELQIHTKIAIAYSTHIMHVLHILTTGKLDPISLLDDDDLWISSPSFVTAIGHAVNGAQVVTDILAYDPELSFIPFFYGIYLLQGSFLLLLVADKLQGDANPSVVRACETMVRAHEACVVTLNTEYQKAFRKVMQSALAQVRGRIPEDASEQHRRRRETLALYRWTGDGTGLAI